MSLENYHEEHNEKQEQIKRLIGTLEQRKEQLLQKENITQEELIEVSETVKSEIDKKAQSAEHVDDDCLLSVAHEMKAVDVDLPVERKREMYEAVEVLDSQVIEARVDAKKEIDELISDNFDIFDLEKINFHIEKTLEDLYDKNLSDEQFLNKYKETRNTVENDIRKAILERENYLFKSKFTKYNQKMEVIDFEKGIYSIKLKNGGSVYGSMYSILDANENLEENIELARKIQFQNHGTIMGMNVNEGGSYRYSMVASGSFAQKEIHNYPIDLDFAEHVDMKVKNIEEFSVIMSNLIKESIVKTDIDEKLEFMELKCGIYPDTFGELAGKSIKWNKEEILAGEKVIGQNKISLKDSLKNPSMIKIDWLTQENDNLKELSKVIKIKVIDFDNKEIFYNRPETSAFQEVYFDNISDFDIAEIIRKPKVLKEYLDFLKNDIKKYKDSNNCFKSAKRLYSLLKVNGNLEEGRKLSELFNSSIAVLSEKLDSINILGKYINDGRNKFDKASFVKSIDQFNVFISNESEIVKESKDSISLELNNIKNILLQEDINKGNILLSIENINKISNKEINDKSLTYLKNIDLFKNI